MSRYHSRRARLAACAWSIVALLVCSACTTSGGPAPSRLEMERDGGFEVTQDIRLGVGPRADFDAALRHLEESENEQAVERLLELTASMPALVSAHINLGIAYRRLERWPQAEASLREAIDLNPRHPVAHNELGMVLRRQGRFSEARESYEEALDVAPRFHFAHRNLAILCDLFLSDAPCALQQYELYAEVMPDDEEVAIWIADLRNRRER